MRAVVGVFVLLGCTVRPSLHAQDVRPPVRVFATGGAGFGSHFTPHASVSLAHSSGDYIVRGALGYGADLGGYSPWGGPRELTEVSLLYGRRMSWRRAWVRGAVGVGYVDGEQLDPVAPGEEPTTSAVGLAAQAGVVWVPVPRFGVGVTGVGNFNEFKTLAAVTLSVHVGGVGG